MPRYDYTCRQCGHSEERQCSIKQRDRQRCDKCGYHFEREQIAKTARMKHNWQMWSGPKMG